MAGRFQIHNFESMIRSALSGIKSSKRISRKNKEIIERFYRQCIAEGMSSSRILKYLYTLKKLALLLGKDFDEAGVGDIAELVGKIETSGLSEWTKHDYKVVIKKFYKWLRGTKGYPDEVEWIKTTMKRRQIPAQILSEDEVRRMIDAASSVRDKALISVLYEGGLRIGELMGLRIRDVQFDRYGAVLIVDGKTGMRRVRLISSAPYLTSWLNMHPGGEDPDSPLWVKMRGGEVVRLSYSAVCDMLKRTALKAGIRKRIHPHIFRHSRATHLSRYLKEAQMNQFFGWVQGSDMPRVYVHLSGRDVDDALFELYGIKREEKRERESRLKPKKCPRCGAINEATNRFCKLCGSPLELRAALEVEEKRRVYEEIIGEVLERNPEIARMIVRKAIEMGLEGKLKKIV